MLCALISNNLVCGLVDISSDEYMQQFSKMYPNVVDISELHPTPAIGWVLKGNELVPTEDSLPSRKITKLAFRKRFTDAEKAGMEGFSAQSNAYAYALRAAMGDQRDATYIDLSLQETVTGVGQLVAMGLLSADRALAILSAEVQETEKYTRGL